MERNLKTGLPGVAENIMKSHALPLPMGVFALAIRHPGTVSMQLGLGEVHMFGASALWQLEAGRRIYSLGGIIISGHIFNNPIFFRFLETVLLHWSCRRGHLVGTCQQ
jgi:hypothetical protein